MPGPHRRRPPLHLLLPALGVAEGEERGPADDRQGAEARDGHRLALRGLVAPRDEGLQAFAILARLQRVRQPLQLRFVLEDDNATAGVHDFVRGRLGGVRGVEARAFAPGEHRRDGRCVPLRRVKSPDVHGLKGLQAQREKALGGAPHVAEIVVVRPRLPLVAGQGRRDLAVLDLGQGPLHQQRCGAALFGSGLRQQGHERRGGRCLGAGDARR
mmetsp:Transcript_23776/g.67682  ORF Transcript_23776/g.67682 Transcript_23776/m.67682 type:complete len:214 (+) Transcript_23776:1556-2197(+)